MRSAIRRPDHTGIAIREGRPIRAPAIRIADWPIWNANDWLQEKGRARAGALEAASEPSQTRVISQCGVSGSFRFKYSS
jgi:hypothetical protein